MELNDNTTKSKYTSAAEVLGMLAGLVFLASSVLKAMDVSAFATIIQGYGFGSLPLAAPAVILVEAWLGLWLGFGIRLRWTAAAGAIVVVVLTALYTYALVFRGITDCGCFGGIKALDTHPWFLYVRNAVLLAMFVFIFLKGTDDVKTSLWTHSAITFVVACIAFEAAFTSDHASKGGYEAIDPVAVADTPIAPFFTASPDSTYLVFVFSHTCPHCLNSVGNLNLYEKAGVADRVVGIAMGDEESEAAFRRVAHPEFEMMTGGSEVLNITNSFPLTLLVKGGKVVARIDGEVPAPAIISAELDEKK